MSMQDTNPAVVDDKAQKRAAQRGWRSYRATTLLLSLVIMPLLYQAGFLLTMFVLSALSTAGINISMQPNTLEYSAIVGVFVLLLGAPLCLTLLLARKKPEIPSSPARRFLPVLIPYACHMLLWALAFGISGYSYASGTWVVLSWLTPTRFISNTMGLFAGNHMVFLLASTAELLAMLLGVQIAALRRRRRLSFRPLSKAFVVVLAAVLAIDGTIAFQLNQHSQSYVSPFIVAEKVGSESEHYKYVPFKEDNVLEVLQEKPEVTIGSQYPRLDGATAAFPVYGAVAQALYKGLDENSALEIVSCNTTPYAYERLFAGEADVFFGAQPSDGQRQAAAAAGRELEMTAIGREAFVFIVNKDNPVDSLTLEQVRAIYQKKITNWSEVGGKDEKIALFQRPEGSGSQTTMIAKVMNGEPMATPMLEEQAASMGGAVDAVAEYRNFSSAIGYSFRYYCTKMKGSEGVKLLAIDGVAPTVENIRDGSYPLTIDFYAVTAGTSNPNVPVLLEWLQGRQGQAFIEQCGYVGIAK